MALSDIVRKAERTINDYNVRRSAARGWLPQATAYKGYGSEETVHVLGRVLYGDPAAPENEAWAQRGYRQFFTVQAPGIPVRVTAGEASATTHSTAQGYVDVQLHGHGLTPGWHDVTIEVLADPNAGIPTDQPPTTAEVLIVGDDQDVGIVSDIDDTVLITWLPRAMTAAWNSWVKRTNTRQPVPGMARFYEKLREDHPNAPVIYLSTGAWNTFDTLETFLEHNGLPKGPMLLTDWGPTPTGLFRSGKEHKRVQLRNLFIAFPQIKWILVGDDGQHDPLTYGDAAEEHPDRVRAIAIRNLTPGEQLLSHGSLTPLVDERDSALGPLPFIQGADGNKLLEAYRAREF